MDHVGDSVLELAFRPEARIIDIDQIPGPKPAGGHKSINAAKLGYDAIRLPGRPGEEHYIVLNRSAVVTRRPDDDTP